MIKPALPFKVVALGSLALLLTGCGSGGKVAAIVNGQVITSEQVDQRMVALNDATRAALGNDRSRLLEEMVTETILFQEAQRRRLGRDQEVQRLLKEARRQILLGRLLEVLRSEDAVKVSDEQVTQFYQNNPDVFREAETFRASHILVPDENLAKSALKRIKDGEAFADVAAELSTDPTKARGGDIGFFKQGQLIPEFEAVVMKLKPGELGDVVKTSLGYHVVLLTEHRLARQLPFEEVKDKVRMQLERRAQQQHVEVTLQELRSKAKIDVREKSSSASAAVAGDAVPPTQ